MLLFESPYEGSTPSPTAVNMDSTPPTSNSSNYKPYVIVLDVQATLIGSLRVGSALLLKLVDRLVLGTSVVRRVGSTPTEGT